MAAAMASERFDAIVVGMGPGGEVAATRLLDAGKRVAAVEQELIGGECGYWACIPSKTVLRPGEVVSEATRAAGVDGAATSWTEARGYRDYMARHLDDSAQVQGYADQGAVVVKGSGRVTGPGRVEVDGRELTADNVIIATGSVAFVPPVDGLDAATVWTNRETFTTADLPGRATIVGGSAVGVETAMFLARFGAAPTIVQRSDRLLRREERRVSELTAEHLGAAGVDVRTGVRPVRARAEGADSVLELDDGTSVDGDVIVFATGRMPRTAGLGLEHAGVRLDDRGAVVVDDQCRAAEGVWAIGDVTSIMAFTHVAKYQGRVVADNILGRERTAHYEGIPRVVFADPEIAAVGLTEEEAEARDLHTRSAEVDLPAVIARPWTYEREPRGHLGLVADVERGVLVGAWAVAPQASEWIHQAAIAIRARIPIDVLSDQVAQFPTYTEGFLRALDALAT
ncbi:MAG TPA: NAD(P)/FAD-dependent oxidoreductase [Acidimicrobiales bacterium]|nr:NAD(P)/FAD-dependent oxidoreductase [Acidimicrobiales bacterium]